jgi:hypothetical protein
LYLPGLDADGAPHQALDSIGYLALLNVSVSMSYAEAKVAGKMIIGPE